MKIFFLVLAGIPIPLFLVYILHRVAYNISNYDFVRQRMKIRKTIALLLIEINGKILFRKKRGSYPGREEYKDTWVLPGGEVSLDKRVIPKADKTDIPPYMWAIAYAEFQTGLKLTCPSEYAERPFSAVYEGGIQLGYAPGEIAIYCAEINDDENNKSIIQSILNGEIEDKKFFLPDEIMNMKHLFHPFYIKHLETITTWRKKIQKEISEKKAQDKDISEKIKKQIQIFHEEIYS